MEQWDYVGRVGVTFKPNVCVAPPTTVTGPKSGERTLADTPALWQCGVLEDHWDLWGSELFLDLATLGLVTCSLPGPYHPLLIPPP